MLRKPLCSRRQRLIGARYKPQPMSRAAWLKGGTVVACIPSASLPVPAQSVAERATKLVQITYQRSHELGKPVLTVADAVRANSFHDPPGTLGVNPQMYWSMGSNHNVMTSLSAVPSQQVASTHVRLPSAGVASCHRGVEA